MWDPPGYESPVEWADACRVMPHTSPFPGPWKTSNAPWLEAPMRAFADPSVDVVVGVMASQLGKTELQFNALGWKWMCHPQPTIYVTPTEKLARTLSKERLPDMLETAPGLKELVDPRFNKPGALERWINSARFGMAWAGSPTELASHPCAMVMVDERSRMPDLPGEGDPMRLAMARTKNYIGSKVGVFSSPTEKGICPTYRLWLQGTRMRWSWECPGCGHWFVPMMAHARSPDGADNQAIKDESWMACPECEHAIRDGDRDAIGQRYIPHVVTDTGELRMADGLEVRNPIASYWVTGFVSPVTGIGDILFQMATAEAEADPGEIRSVVNTYAGELYEVQGDGATADAVDGRESEEIGDVQMVTAGVDVQADSVFYVVRGWGAHAQSWLLDHGQLMGATEYDEVWIALQSVLEGEFCNVRVGRVMVDSGYQTKQVYDVCRRTGWQPARGHERQDRPFYDSTVDESATGRAMRGFKLWHHCNDTWKQWLYSRILAEGDGPSAWWVPRGIDDEYKAQITNERYRTDGSKRKWYRTGNRRNHYLDCEILAAVAAHSINVRALKPRARPSPSAPPARAQRGPSDPRMIRRGL